MPERLMISAAPETLTIDELGDAAHTLIGVLVEACNDHEHGCEVFCALLETLVKTARTLGVNTAQSHRVM
jgi:hypothetical protein